MDEIKHYTQYDQIFDGAETQEKQWNSQLARRIVLAIPREIPPEQHADLIRDYCREFFVSKGQIRSALTAVMQRQISMPGTFDENGWLKIGFSGSQINMSEPYINTGSLYMCTAVFLPLGLPANHPFRTEPYSEWTNLKAWKGVDVGADKALRKG